MPEQQSLDMWAIVEVMGHKRYAGHVTEQAIGSAALIRVDVPATEQPERNTWSQLIPARTTAAYSKLIGPASIYQITPCTEEVARKAAVVIESDNDPIPVAIPETHRIAPPLASLDDDAELDDGDEIEDHDEAVDYADTFK